MQERDSVTVDRLDRDRQAVRSDPAREGHDPGGGCRRGATEWPLDVDPTVLTGGEWIFLVEVEHLQHRAGDRPASTPGPRRGQRVRRARPRPLRVREPSVVASSANRYDGNKQARCCQTDYSEVGRAGFATRRSGARRVPQPVAAAARPPPAPRPRPSAASSVSPARLAEHDRHLAAHRFPKRRASSATLPRRPPRTASSARGTPRTAGRGRAREDPQRARQPLRRLECHDRPPPARELLATAPAAPAAPRQVADELVALPHEPARHERGLNRRAPGSTVTGTPASSAAPEPRARIVDSRQAGVAHERHPLARLAGAAAAPPSASPRCARGRRASRAGSCRSSRPACAACPRRARRRPRRAPRSTRSVTSSRFPIGVAQTASGTSSPRRAPRTRPCRRRSRPHRRRARPDDPHRVAAARAPRPRPPRGPAEQQLARHAEPAADDHDLRVRRR